MQNTEYRREESAYYMASSLIDTVHYKTRGGDGGGTVKGATDAMDGQPTNCLRKPTAPTK